jgi:hypothetical protein
LGQAIGKLAGVMTGPAIPSIYKLHIWMETGPNRVLEEPE